LGLNIWALGESELVLVCITLHPEPLRNSWELLEVADNKQQSSFPNFGMPSALYTTGDLYPGPKVQGEIWNKERQIWRN
jgi:hypothetical protein